MQFAAASVANWSILIAMLCSVLGTELTYKFYENSRYDSSAFCAWQARIHAGHGEYSRANWLADLTLSHFRRGAKDTKDVYQEGLVCTLIELGRYEDAYLIFKSLPHFPWESATSTPLERQCQAPIVAFRRILLADILLGLHRYDEAIAELSTPIPDLIDGNCCHVDLEICLTKVYLAKNDSAAAIDTLGKVSRRHPNQAYISLFSSMAGLKSGDQSGGNAIATSVLEFCRKAERSGDHEGVADLQFAGNFLESKGCSQASVACFEESAKRLRQ